MRPDSSTGGPSSLNGGIMFAEQLREAVVASPRTELPKISALLWNAYAAGTLTEAEASELSDLIETRKIIPTPQKPTQRRVGSRPRSPTSTERRRSWAACGRLPPQIAARFTLAEQAVLAVMSVEIAAKGACTLTLEHIAALAGVCRSTVKNALREAQGLGLVRIEERRLTAWRNLPNRITITSSEWSAWLKRRGGGKTVPRTNTPSFQKGKRRADSLHRNPPGQRNEERMAGIMGRGRTQP